MHLIFWFKSRCDYLPLCNFVTLQPPAADQEIQSQTHCALTVDEGTAALNQCQSTCKDRMFTREDVVIHPHCAWITTKQS